MKEHPDEIFLQAYIDGEFSESERRHLETHLAECPPCQKLADQHAAWKRATKEAVAVSDAAIVTPPELMERIHDALFTGAQSVARSSTVTESDGDSGSGNALVAPRRQDGALPQAQAAMSRRPGRQWLGYLAPLAAAAAIVIFVRHRTASPALEQSVLTHQRAWPVEIQNSDPDGVASWFRGKLNFPVRPLRLGTDARLIGGRLGNVDRQHAAELVYQGQGGRRITVLVFDPSNVSVEAPRRVIVANHPVFVATQHGYNVALFQDRGVGYAVASELDEDQTLHLVADSLDARRRRRVLESVMPSRMSRPADESRSSGNGVDLPASHIEPSYSQGQGVFGQGVVIPAQEGPQGRFDESTAGTGD